MILLGIGKAGIQIINKFKDNSAYKLVYIDGDIIPQEYKQTKVQLRKQTNPEEYESLSDLTELEEYAKKELDNEVCLVMASSGKISGIALRVLEIFDGRKLSVLLIRPESNILNGFRKLQDRAVYGILQEYARSGKLKELFIINNEFVEELFGRLPVYSYFEKINTAICQTFHMLQVMRHNESVMQSPLDISDIARICTFGLAELSEGEEKPFMKLKNIKNKEFFFLVPKQQLEEDVDLLENIRNFVNNNTENNVESGYRLFESVGDNLYGLCIHYSSKIQEVEDFSYQQ